MTRAALAPSPPHSAPRKDEYYSEWMMWWELEARWEYGWDHENRLIRVVHWRTYNETGMYYLRPWKRVEFYYCPACGGNRTQKVVHMNDNWAVEDTPDWTLTKWLRYETLGLDQLRVDEKYDSDQDGLDEGDPFRTERVTYDAPSGIGYIMKETLYTYSTPYTASNPSKEDIWYHYDRMMVVNALSNTDGAFIVGQRFNGDAFGQFEGSAVKTTRRITGKEWDGDVELYYFNARWYASSTPVFVSRGPMPPDMEHTYAFCQANPLRLMDFDGRWGWDVHWYGTYRRCIDMGGHPALCRVIADANQGFDEAPSTRPMPAGCAPNNWGCHPQEHFPLDPMDPWDEAVAAANDCNAAGFGRALHRMQDFFSHVYPLYPGCTYADCQTRHVLEWHDPDKVCLHFEEVKLAIEFTEMLLTIFLENCNQRVKI